MCPAHRLAVAETSFLQTALAFDRRLFVARIYLRVRHPFFADRPYQTYLVCPVCPAYLLAFFDLAFVFPVLFLLALYCIWHPYRQD